MLISRQAKFDRLIGKWFGSDCAFSPRVVSQPQKVMMKSQGGFIPQWGVEKITHNQKVAFYVAIKSFI
ncbi:hypothetical protein D2924_14605 [Vibrio cholerae]|nr:hypothetical protein D2924_14605 [Vibrio cholerae]TLE30344.1 hypothetical protein D2925_14290 [Vibrio cholerae]